MREAALLREQMCQSSREPLNNKAMDDDLGVPTSSDFMVTKDDPTNKMSSIVSTHMV